jgi:protocatechuate 3,4-dioxygenase beta subunit
MKLEKITIDSPLSRRDAIKLGGKLGGAAIFVLTGCGSTTPGPGKNSMRTGTPNGGLCQKATNVTRGPYFVDEKSDPNISGDQVDANVPMRSDIRADTEGNTGVQPGLPLALKLMIGSYSTKGSCAPLANAQVDIWHCNAQGVYSDIDYSAAPPPTPQPSPSASPSPDASPDMSGTPINNEVSTAGQNFLRGYQMTDASGAASFQTIYPGWYMGRAVHIHIKVRVFDASGAVTTEATTQLFFNDQMTNVVYLSNQAYQRSSMRDTLNSGDVVFAGEKPPLFVNVIGSATAGYTATVQLGVQVGTTFGG